LKAANITHGDDPDGLICGALLKRLFGADVIPANYDTLESALSSISVDVDQLFITDINLREALLVLIEQIAKHASITIIDHHPYTQELTHTLVNLGIKIIHDTRDCASILVYDAFKEELDQNAAREAVYASISDMFEDGPIASRILDRMDRKFAQHEALLLNHSLSSNQSDSFKARLVEELSKYTYPHRIPGVVESAVTHLEHVVAVRVEVQSRAVKRGRWAYMLCTDEELSTGEMANVIMDTLGVEVGVAYKLNGGWVNVSLRGERRLQENLGEIARDVAHRHGGFGGGHGRASGAKIPETELESFIEEIESMFS
jgi:oligoribonuclease NrnB/cAMP/cGMP phosphodiesterase (DHH superfamily)